MTDLRRRIPSALGRPFRPIARWLSVHGEDTAFHAVLFAITFVTTTLAWALFFGGRATFANAVLEGLRFSIPVLLIMGSHEGAHFFMCRRYGIPATRPYFLPGPNLFGTFGAVIRIKQPIQDKRILLDVGASGPIAGFIVTLPFLFYGVTRAVPLNGPPQPQTTYFGYPLMVHIVQDLTHSGHYTSLIVREDPTFMAGWFGLLITALNLLPIGQLDGGHVLRAVLGRRQPVVSAAIVVIAVASIGVGGFPWAFWAFIVSLLVGIAHPAVANDDEALGPGRLLVATLCLIVLILSVTLTPITRL